MDPHDVYTMLNRGRDLLGQGHAHQAATVLERATRLEPEKTSVRETFARALYQSGQKRRAREEFARVLELDPSNDYAYFGLGLCEAAVGNTTGAIGHLRLALAMRPESEDYRRALQALAG
ncbi:MAG TPA: tetratricopeptide repeat protein [Actinomycetota bacterium]|nr:tetratricopeptide repeat protein [Actinomycetota bacterium]